MTFLVLGLGVSGRAAVELLLREGKQVIAVDQKAEQYLDDPCVQSYMQQGMRLFLDTDPIAWEEIQEVILSPGVSPLHPIVVKAKTYSRAVTGETAFAFRYLTNQAIGVTGTNGKTTTTLFITHLLQTAGFKACSLGNIGRSVSEYALQPDPQEILVVELSSFQLETLETKCLDSAVLLNITPDHLDRYASLLDYALTKCRIGALVKEGGRFFVSQAVWGGYAHFLTALAPQLFYEQFSEQNVQAAHSVAKQWGIAESLFMQALQSFVKPTHRMEKVAEWNGITFYNDSKATNVESVLYAVRSLSGPIALLAGGMDKGAPYTPWIEAFRGKVQWIIAFGAARHTIAETLSTHFFILKVDTLEEAVHAAIQEVQRWRETLRPFAKSVTILLSPGGSSFDQFRNFSHRGERFRDIVQEKTWIEEKQS